MALRYLLIDDVTGKPKRGAVPVSVPDIRSASTALSDGDTFKAVAFSSNMPSINYAVTANLLNTVDGSVTFHPIVVTAQSVSGFTARWNTGIDGGNYVLMSVAVSHV